MVLWESLNATKHCTDRKGIVMISIDLLFKINLYLDPLSSKI